MDYRKQLIDNIRSDTVVIGIKDHLSSNTQFNPWLHKMPVIVEMLSDMCTYYSDKKFIIFTSLENLEYYLKNDNATIIPWGGDITNQQLEYPTITPIINKNLNSQSTFLSLNRNNRIHRAMLVSLLYGMNLESNGLISWMHKDNVDNLFTDNSFRNNGLVVNPLVNDVGRYRLTLLTQDYYKFKVPSLRNVAVTAPYMHDGRFGTLAAVMNHYQQGVVQSATLDPILQQNGNLGIPLSDEDKSQLIAFLNTLTDYQYLNDPRFSE